MVTRSLGCLSLVVLLGACSTASTIQNADSSQSAFRSEPNVIDPVPDGVDQYRVYHRAATGFVSIQSIRQSAEKRAVSFCSNKGQSMQVVSEQTSNPPYILGNFPRIELLFACNDTLASARTADYQDEQYLKLLNLKKLLDEGVITQEEFQAEKKEILSQ